MQSDPSRFISEEGKVHSFQRKIFVPRCSRSKKGILQALKGLTGEVVEGGSDVVKW